MGVRAGAIESPPFFFSVSENCVTVRRRFWHTYSYRFLHLKKKIEPRSLKVRSPGHVKSDPDLDKAFQQLSLHPADRDVTRFLGRKNASDYMPITYRMTRVVFGVDASPFLLQATLRRHLELCKSSDRDLANLLSRDIYCDDLITSVSTVAEAQHVMDRSIEIFENAKMNKTKWA